MFFHCSNTVLLMTTFSFSVLLVTSLVLAFYGIPKIVDIMIAQNVRLENGTKQWDRFVELPFEINFKVHIFQITNVEEVWTMGAKPILEETGPYVYKETRKKVIYFVNNEEDSVTFEQTANFTFSLEDSIGPDTDVVTVLNPALIGLLNVASEYPTYEQLILNQFLPTLFSKYSLFTTARVRDLLFDGIEFATKDNCTMVCRVVRNIVINEAKRFKNIRPSEDGLLFSFFTYKTLPDGIFAMSRGIDDITTLGHVLRWNNKTHLDYWGNSKSVNNETCSLIRGGDSTIYAPNIKENMILDIYSTDICRIMSIGYVGHDEYHGIEGYRFEANKNTFRNVTVNPENDCYCIKLSKDKNGINSCFLNGVVDIFPCIGLPVLLSFPHFMWADEYYLNDVKNLRPDETKHKSFLLVEPNTGTPLRGATRIQLNVVLTPDNIFTIGKNLPRATLPLIWVEEEFSLPEQYINDLNDLYFDKLKSANIGKYSFIVISTMGLITCTVFLTNRYFFV